MMSGGIATYMVTEPKFSWELRSRLLHAANVGTTATFTATSLDDASEAPRHHMFTVTVNAAQFEAPAAFDVKDEEGHFIQIKFNPSEDRVTFSVFI